ncbi:MAG: TonB-dependent receptor [Gammaproteobacteria bacterium]|nr:TonB-dependent receptor [Gammaproteobacteria bacterium]MCY4283680.1 TonB-dependent receptor [Gammaproteobacteria bacterium]MCY4339139.1 TonB-dependent receptor [Gammaproteobacteria bacterium]
MNNTLHTWVNASDFVTAVLLVTLIPALTSPAVAQGVPDALEEVIVTAQKRSASLQNEAITVTALGAEDISRAGGIDPEILGVLVPNLHVGEETNRDGMQITIRGVSGTDVRNGADPTTAFHVDGGYVPRLSGANAYFFDLERIEVLRGPQGTLYGRNSTAGVVNVITRKPDFDSFGGSLEVAAGKYDLFRTQGALNVPLAKNLAARLAFITSDRDGYRKNAPAKDGDDADEFGLRSHILFAPTEHTSLLLTAEYYERKGVGGVASYHSFPGDTSGLESPDPAGVNAIDTQGYRDNSDTNFRLELNHDFGLFAVTYLGAYREHERDFLADADFTALREIESFVGETMMSDTWTHEVRLTSTHEGPLQYIIGGYYLDEEIDGDFLVGLTTGPGFPAGGGLPFRVRFVDQGLTNESLAGFLHATFDLNDQWQLVGGVRYTDDEKDKGGTLDDVGTTADTATGSFQTVGIAGGPTFFLAPQISNPSFDKTTWEVGLNFSPNADNLLYASASTGFKAGGFNRGSQAFPGADSLVVFKPETVTAYEIGWKTDLFDKRARLNVAAFYYDYKDLQQSQTFVNDAGTITNQTINATSANVWGIEAEGTALVGHSGRLSVALGYLDTEFESFTGVDDALVVGFQSFDASGNRLTRAPEFTATIALVPLIWSAPFGGTFEPRVQFHYQSNVSLSILDRPFEQQDSYTRTDVSLRYQSGGGFWYAELYGLNLENEDVATYQECFDFRQVGAATRQCERTYAAPLTWGARIGVQF